MSFFGEIRRRNVFKVGAAYVVVAWLLIQLSELVFSAVTLPARTVTFATWAFLLGFPATVFLAWAYEVTPEGTNKSQRVKTSTARSRPTQNLHSRTVRRR